MSAILRLVIQPDGKEIELHFVIFMVATGLKIFDPKPFNEYKYGTLPDVITSLELEKW
jgi:heterodisulfide reductase subunit A-like polyferredoxin